MAAYDDLNVKRIFTVGVISIVVLAVTVLAVQVISYTMLEWQSAAKSEQSDYTRQKTILKEQTDQISTYGVDPLSGNITIPIDHAIQLIADESKQTKLNEAKPKANDT